MGNNFLEKVIWMFDLPEDSELDSLYLEEEIGLEHDHTAAEIILEESEGSCLCLLTEDTVSPKIHPSEFETLAVHQRANNGVVIPTPRLPTINSFIAYHKKQEMSGITVGQTTSQDLENFSDDKAFGKSKCSGSLI